MFKAHGTHGSEVFVQSSIRIIYYRTKAITIIRTYNTLPTIFLLALFFYYFILKAIEPQ